MIAKNCYTSLIIGLLLSLAWPIAQGDTESVSVTEAAALASNKHAVIVDVREDSEWREQHIPGAIHIPLGELPKRLDELKKHQNSPIITQCRSGGRSLQALDIMKSAGFNNVYSLTGGIMAWQKAGLPTE